YPGHAPDHILRACGVVTRAQRIGSADFAAELLRQVLDVGLQQEGTGIEEKDPQARSAAMAIKLFSAIAAEHAGADDDRIEWMSARPLGRRDLLPIVADVAGNDVIAEVGLLNVVPSQIGVCYQLVQRHALTLIRFGRFARLALATWRRRLT